MKTKKKCKLGNKTHCDICSSKAVRKARLKKEQKEAPPSTNADASENPDEVVAPPAPTPHHHAGHDDGIFNGYKITHSERNLHQLPS